MLFFVVNLQAQTVVPSGLRVDLALHTNKVWKNGFPVSQNLEEVKRQPRVFQARRIASQKPWFTWMIDGEEPGAVAYQVLVASSARQLQSGTGDVWNSGRVAGKGVLPVEYNGKPLRPNTVYYWKVRVWNHKGVATSFSKPSAFLTDSVLKPYQPPPTLLEKSVQQPVSHRERGNGNRFYDFGKDAFGQISLMVKADGDKDTLLIHIGEAVNEKGGVDRKPRGTIRYRLVKLPLKKGQHRYQPVFEADKRNTGAKAIRMPEYIGEVFPFRYVEIEKTRGPVSVESVQRYMVNELFDEEAAVFESADTVLNQIWDLCKYTMKATSFTGLYVDGDRERIPYEADALINQLSHYATDAEFNMAKRTLAYLVYNPTWPTEWSLQNLLIAWYDYRYSGDIRLVRILYDQLRPKLLLPLARPDGLISTRTGLQDSAFSASIHYTAFDGKAVLKDIVDWPQKGGFGLPPDAPGEADNFVFTDYNSVVNAFHYQALLCMQELANALGKEEDAAFFQSRAAKLKKAFRLSFIDQVLGIVKDGEDTEHSSLHANMMALAFGLVPEQNKAAVLAHIRSKGMACSVYGAQFLLEALYDAGEADYGLELLTATGKRSWYNMLRTGSTLTTEAWDTDYKSNQDWNHAWGAAPANIIVSRLMGLTPLSPGFEKLSVKPRPGSLPHASLQLPTLRGRVAVSFIKTDTSFQMTTSLPANTGGRIYLPRRSDGDQVWMNGKRIVVPFEGDFWVIGDAAPGKANWRVDYTGNF